MTEVYPSKSNKENAKPEKEEEEDDFSCAGKRVRNQVVYDVMQPR